MTDLLIPRQNTELPAYNAVSIKAATVAVAHALNTDPDFRTDALHGVSAYDAKKHLTGKGAEEYVEHKPERYAIAAVFSGRAADDLLTKPDDPKETRYLALPDVHDPDIERHLRRIRTPDEHRFAPEGLSGQIRALIDMEATSFLSEHPELKGVNDRFMVISAANPLDTDVINAKGVISNIAFAMNTQVLGDFLSLTQRLIHENIKHPLLQTPEQRLEFVRDAADKLLFDVAALNLGHFLHIDESDGPWNNFDIGLNLEADIMHSEEKGWVIKYKPGNRLPSKPKTGLAGPTLACPALMQVEGDDAASPLHRFVYATINAAYDRGMLDDMSIGRAVESIQSTIMARTKQRRQMEASLARFDEW